SHRLRSGDAVADIATETGISAATLFRWKDQALIDAGVRGGVPSIESDELASARAQIAALDAELALTRDACALFDDQSVAPPKKGRSRSSKD
ncbi:transposase, partial [Rhodococcus cerastii]|nr:transposase [Rhodococcus cerastii]